MSKIIEHTGHAHVSWWSRRRRAAAWGSILDGNSSVLSVGW